MARIVKLSETTKEELLKSYEEIIKFSAKRNNRLYEEQMERNTNETAFQKTLRGSKIYLKSRENNNK